MQASSVAMKKERMRSSSVTNPWLEQMRKKMRKQDIN